MSDPITAFGHFVLALFRRTAAAPAVCAQPAYDPADDARKSYDAAVAAKRARGDVHWPSRQERSHDPEIAAQLAELKDSLERQIDLDERSRKRWGAHG